jgi:hypothetical protein
MSDPSLYARLASPRFYLAVVFVSVMCPPSFEASFLRRASGGILPDCIHFGCTFSLSFFGLLFFETSFP